MKNCPISHTLTPKSDLLTPKFINFHQKYGNLCICFVNYCKLPLHMQKKVPPKGGVAGTGALKILALPKRGGGLTYAKNFLVDL